MAKDSTRRRYRDVMKLFTEITEKTPRELILEAEIKSEKLMRERQVRSYLLRFKRLLEERNTTPKKDFHYPNTKHIPRQQS